MELALALELLSGRPVAADEHRAACRGAWLPVSVPVAWLDADTRAAWLLDGSTAPLDVRLRAALDADREDAAWRLLAHLGGAVAHDFDLGVPLQSWAARRLAELKLPATQDLVLIGAGDDEHRLRKVAVDALRDVRHMFAPLLWPRWIGPAILVVGDAPVGRLPGDAEVLARPALPLLRLRRAPAPAERRATLAAAWCRLVLAREAGTAQWPAWFQRGMQGVARAKGRGEGPSPRAMQARRGAAGVDGLRRCLLGDDPDPAIATAICAYLMHSRRVHRLPALLELLRNRSDSLTALDIAYEVDLAGLARRR